MVKYLVVHHCVGRIETTRTLSAVRFRDTIATKGYSALLALHNGAGFSFSTVSKLNILTHMHGSDNLTPVNAR